MAQLQTGGKYEEKCEHLGILSSSSSYFDMLLLYDIFERFSNALSLSSSSYCFMKPDICRCLTPMHYEAWKKCQHLQQKPCNKNQHNHHHRDYDDYEYLQ